MAKFVIAGRADCPYYAKAELLADDLQLNLPQFSVFKIPVHPEKWGEWVEGTVERHGWAGRHDGTSPLVWRELIDRGGKGLLIGGANDFQEFVAHTYGITSQLQSATLRHTAQENNAYKLRDIEEDARRQAAINPLVCVVTSAASPIGYSLFPQLVDGSTFGKGEEVELRLLETDEESLEVARGTLMEVEDLACGVYRRGGVYSDVEDAMRGASVVVVLDSILPDHTIEEETLRRHHYLASVKSHFTWLGEAINGGASRSCKVLVAGLVPVNFATECLLKACPGLAPFNVVGMVRYQEKLAKALIAAKMKTNAALVEDVLVWGNLAGTTVTEVRRSRTRECAHTAITGPSWYCRSTTELLHDNKWVETEFRERLKSRTGELTCALRHPPYMLYAAAVAETLAAWSLGSDTKFMASLAVPLPRDLYGFQQGTVVSLPVKFFPGSYELLESLGLSAEDEAAFAAIRAEMDADRELADNLPQPEAPPPVDGNQDFEPGAEEGAESREVAEGELPEVVLEETPAPEGAAAPDLPGEPVVEPEEPVGEPEEATAEPEEVAEGETPPEDTPAE